MQILRLRWAAAILLACSLALLPSAASARPAHRASHRVTINAAPNPITKGEGVTIFGRLTGPNHNNQRVQLYHRLPGQRFFKLVQTTRTDSKGRYEFLRGPGVVDTNRAFYVFSDGASSRRIRELVHAAISLRPPASDTRVLTGTPYSFTGTVSPTHTGEKVFLQRKQGVGDDWFTIGEGRIKAHGSYLIVHVFRYPGNDPSVSGALGDSEVRVRFRGDSRNIRSSSNSLSLQISQKQNPNLTIDASPDPITLGQTTTVSGKSVSAGQTVTLQARTDRTPFGNVATVKTDGSGNYFFPNLAPVNNTLYRVIAPAQTSAALYVGVKDAIDGTASNSSTKAGSRVTFTGSVKPDKTGHVLYLQRQNRRTGDYYTVQVAFVGAGSKYIITHRISFPGNPAVFRVRIPGGPENQGAATQPIPIKVTQGPIPLG